MRTTLQGTGYEPMTFDYTHRHTSTQMLDGDKRGVRLTFYDLRDDQGVLRYRRAELVYLTTWPTEREFTRLYAQNHLNAVVDTIRSDAKSVLPPGAGYPATPQFETRQAKLAGMLETATLVALSDVLKQAADLDPPRHPGTPERKPLPGAIAGCNQGNLCPWTDGDPSHCKACGLRAMGSGQ